MTRRTRLRYSEADKALMWDRWHNGDSMNEIVRRLGHTVEKTLDFETPAERFNECVVSIG